MLNTQRLVAGVDIGGTKTAIVLAHRLPEVIAKVTFPTLPERGPEYAIQQIIDSLEELLREKHFEGRLEAIGISCGGPLDAVAGVVQSPPNLRTWIEVPICEMLHKHFEVPCRLENDANACALAEARYGAGKGTRNFIFLTMGTGFGAGFILNGEIYQGSTCSAGEIGHVRLSDDGPEGYGKIGSVEGWVSGAGMAKVASRQVAEAHHLRRSTTLSVPAALGTLSAREVAAALAQGDEVAAEIVSTTAHRLGETLAMLIDLLDPDCIAIGGLALRFGDRLLDPARKVILREALDRPARHCRIVTAELGEQIGDIAALSIACEALRFSTNPYGEILVS